MLRHYFDFFAGVVAPPFPVPVVPRASCEARGMQTAIRRPQRQGLAKLTSKAKKVERQRTPFSATSSAPSLFFSVPSTTFGCGSSFASLQTARAGAAVSRAVSLGGPVESVACRISQRIARGDERLN